MVAKVKKRKKFIFGVCLANDIYELPIFVGNLKEVSLFVNSSCQNVHKRSLAGGTINKKYKIFRVEEISEEMEMLEEENGGVEDG